MPEVDLGSDKEDKDEEDQKKKKFSGKSDSETRRGEFQSALLDWRFG